MGASRGGRKYGSAVLEEEGDEGKKIRTNLPTSLYLYRCRKKV